MNIELRSDFPITDDACKEATGKTFKEWYAILDEKGFTGRREATNWLWDTTGRSPTGAWWGITIWVEYERQKGKLAKDGRIEGYGICSTKTVAAPVERVQEELLKAVSTAEVTRVRDGKDIRAKWQTPGIEGQNDVEVLLAPKDGKVGITLNHNRIQTREESDGLRRAWTDALNAVKKSCEG